MKISELLTLQQDLQGQLQSRGRCSCMLCRACRLFNASAERVMWRLRSRLFEHIIHQEVGFFDRVRTGELMNRLSEVRQLQSSCCTSHAKHHEQAHLDSLQVCRWEMVYYFDFLNLANFEF